MKFYSTNGISEPVSFEDALFKGQAPDGGLYMPQSIPKFSRGEISSMRGMQYPDIVTEVLHPFLEDGMPREDLEDIAWHAYQDFPIPLEHVDDGKYIMRQDRGPTASFKDFAGVLIGKLVSYYTESDISVIIVYPQDEVTAMQRKQMTTLGGNVRAIAVERGKFDDCQAMNKRAFSDPELKHLNLSSANSINIGRLLPQVCYYFYPHSQLCEGDQKSVFAVPCGNIGSLTGGLIAKRMGLPVSKYVAAVNENDVFPKFLQSGVYEPIVPSINCVSSAMNVGLQSNAMRVVDLHGGRMDKEGTIHKKPNMDAMREDIYSVSITDELTRKTIRDMYDAYKIILEPHGAVGWAGLENYLSEKGTDDNSVFVSLETAHPAKFPEVIKEVLGIEPELPESMKGLAGKKEHIEVIPNEYERFKQILLEYGTDTFIVSIATSGDTGSAMGSGFYRPKPVA